MIFNAVIYINGERRACTEVGLRFWADSDSLPNRPCSQHSLKRESVDHLKSGGSVRTSGNVYSLRPPPTLEAALAELQRMIRAGHEYPDAHTAVVLNHKVDGDKLRDAYDEACAR